MKDDKHKEFVSPISKKLHPTYATIVKTPMDLNTMREKVRMDRAAEQVYAHYASIN